jgi:hypothetical protein
LFLLFQSFPMKEKNMYVNEFVLMAFAFLLVMTPVVIMLVLAEEERRHEAHARQLQRQIVGLRNERDSLLQRLHGYDLDMAGMETVLAQARADQGDRDQRTLDTATTFHRSH